MSPDPPSSDHPADWKFGFGSYHAESRAQWRRWLEADHESEPGGPATIVEKAERGERARG